MIEQIIIRDLQNKIILKKEYLRNTTEIKPFKQPLSPSRFFFEFQNKIYNYKQYKDCKIEFISTNENGFLIQSCIEKLNVLLLRILKEISVRTITNKFTDVLFLVDLMFMNGKIVLVDFECLMAEYRSFCLLRNEPIK